MTAPARPLLQVVIASTRPGRVGEPVAAWFHALAVADGRFEVELVDLKKVALPAFDEPHHPRLGRYVHDHTHRWSETVRRADAFVVVMPEYNYGFTAELKNAVDHLHAEWNDKAIGFVSYGGVAAGTRAVQMFKQVVTTLRMVPVFESVNIPFVANRIDSTGALRPDEILDTAAAAMLVELDRWTEPLRMVRASRRRS